MKRRKRAPDSSSSTFRQRPCPDGQTEAARGGRVGVRTMVGRLRWGEDGSDKETLVDVKICPIFHANIERLCLSHTQLCSVLFIFASPLAASVDGMFARLPFAPLRHDVILTKWGDVLFIVFFLKKKKNKTSFSGQLQTVAQSYLKDIKMGKKTKQNMGCKFGCYDS